MHEPRFVLAGETLLRVDKIEAIDLAELDALRVRLRHAGGTAVAEGVHAIEALMLLKPSALEGRRLRWARRAWAVHNLVGHPLMQVLSSLGFPRAALAVHDGTVPRPKGRK